AKMALEATEKISVENVGHVDAFGEPRQLGGCAQVDAALDAHRDRGGPAIRLHDAQNRSGIETAGKREAKVPRALSSHINGALERQVDTFQVLLLAKVGLRRRGGLPIGFKADPPAARVICRDGGRGQRLDVLKQCVLSQELAEREELRQAARIDLSRHVRMNQQALDLGSEDHLVGELGIVERLRAETIIDEYEAVLTRIPQSGRKGAVQLPQEARPPRLKAHQ